MRDPKQQPSIGKQPNGICATKRDYVLGTGVSAVPRLWLLDYIFGAASRELLTKLGLKLANSVAEIGCGTGLMTLWIADQIASQGSLWGIDISQQQIDVASQNGAAAGLKNISFRVASADDTRLPRAPFDVVYSRFLMCHLTNPDQALREMWALLKSGGVLVCEDFEMSAVCTKPATHAYERLAAISRALDRELGVDSDIGPKLRSLFAINGCGSPKVATYEPTFRSGEAKEFWRITLREAASAIVEYGIAGAEELYALDDELKRIDNNDFILVVLARVYQVWSRKC
jgi:predicted O-methyltransferase YrrM